GVVETDARLLPSSKLRYFGRPWASKPWIEMTTPTTEIASARGLIMTGLLSALGYLCLAWAMHFILEVQRGQRLIVARWPGSARNGRPSTVIARLSSTISAMPVARSSVLAATFLRSVEVNSSEATSFAL